MSNTRLLIAISPLVFLFACTGTSVKLFDHTVVEGRERPRKESVRPIIWGDDKAARSLDPNRPDGKNAVTTLIHARLFRETATGNIVGDLATSMEIDSESPSIAVRLVETARWHDRQPVTAEDVVATWKHVRSLKDGASHAALNAVRNVDTVGAYEVRFTLAKPDPDFRRRLAEVTILPAHLIDAGADAIETLGIGAGPFRLVERSPTTCILAPNLDWHGGEIRPPGVIVRAIPDERDRARALAAGRIDATLVTRSYLPLVGDGERFRILEAGEQGVFACLRELEGLQVGKINASHQAPRFLWRARWRE